MGILDFFSGLIKPAFDLVDDLVTTDEERMKLKNKLMEIQNQANEKLLEYESKVVEAKSKIMVAELQQGDNYTKRARPTVLYGGLIILLLNYVILPWIAYFTGKVIPSINLPDMFWVAWGGTASVYTFSRTKEKINRGES